MLSLNWNKLTQKLYVRQKIIGKCSINRIWLIEQRGVQSSVTFRKIIKKVEYIYISK